MVIYATSTTNAFFCFFEFVCFEPVKQNNSQYARLITGGFSGIR